MIKELAKQNESFIIECRRWLHKNPELGEQEFKTTAFIKEKLEEMGIEVETFDGITGCVATIKGNNPDGKTVMLRADIDALPITEISDKDYKSENDGVMHACGHDCHTAMLLGSAKILVEQKDKINGTVKLIFQMAEEIGRRSEEYVKRGVLKGVDAIFGMHVWASMDVGTANFQYGNRMACSDRFKITISGKAAHGSAPHQGQDAILTGAMTVLALQSIESRNVHPQQGFVLTVGMMNGGTKQNIICDTVEIVGTVRAFDRELRKSIPERLKQIVNGITAAYGCTSEVEYIFGTDPLINEHKDLCNLAENVAKNIVGEDCLIQVDEMMGAEDFSVYLTETAGIYGYIGVRNKDKGISCSHHQSCFDIDEDVLQQGSAIYSQFAVDFLNEK